jgi:hypothetical protein
VQRIQPRLVLDWIAGRPHGVRLATAGATARRAKRVGFLAACAFCAAALAGAAWARRRHA